LLLSLWLVVVVVGVVGVVVVVVCGVVVVVVVVVVAPLSLLLLLLAVDLTLKTSAGSCFRFSFSSVLFRSVDLEGTHPILCEEERTKTENFK